MKTLLNLFVQILLVCGLLMAMSCSTKTDSSKEAAEEKNDDKFATKNGEQDAQFLVNAVDNSYAIINLAKLAKEKGSKETAAKANEIMDGQTNILDALKEYAGEQVISVPSSGPEKIPDAQKDLLDEHKDFDAKWCREITSENKKMLNAFEEYSEKTDGGLKNIITKALPTLRSHQDDLQAYQVAVND